MNKIKQYKVEFCFKKYENIDCYEENMNSIKL